MEPFIGQIQAFGFNFAPQGWAKCDGALLPISQNSALFSLLGTIYGGDGRTTFKLPDLRGRSMVHYGTGPGLGNINIGQVGGAEFHTLTIGQMPNHTHNIGVSSDTGEEANPTGKYIGAHTGAFVEDPNGNLAPPTSIGGNQSFSLRNPFVGVNVCIALFGVYPSRS